MSDVHCLEAMQLLNNVFGSIAIFNDGHEILARLEAGDDVADVIDGLNVRFGNRDQADAVRRVITGWPPLHVQAAAHMVRWALGKLDTPDRVLIKYRGDNDHPSTVTRFELEDHTLTIEFAHPPAAATA